MSTAATGTVSPSIAPSAARAFGGIWRLTWYVYITPGRIVRLLVMLAVLAVLTLATVDHGDSGQFFEWSTRFYLTFLLPVMAFLTGSGAMRDETKPISVDYVLTRPIRRPVLVAWKYLSHLACSQFIYLLALAVLLGVGYYRGISGVGDAIPRFLLAQVLAGTVFMALGFFCAAITSRYLLLGLAYAAIVEVGIGSIPTQISRLSLVHHLKTILLPFDSSLVQLLFGARETASALGTTALLLAVAAGLVLAAGVLFNFQELAGSRNKET